MKDPAAHKFSNSLICDIQINMLLTMYRSPRTQNVSDFNVIFQGHSRSSVIRAGVNYMRCNYNCYYLASANYNYRQSGAFANR